MIESRIGFMQGRLSPMIGGKIQAFPWDYWQQEIVTAKQIGISVMEWTLDQERLHQNPFMTDSGQREARLLCDEHDFNIASLTADCFMQAPFWKVRDSTQRGELKNDFRAVITACSRIGVSLIVVPLVDNGCLEDAEQEDVLVDFLLQQKSYLQEMGVRIAFESDFPPRELSRFILQFPSDVFGINYDIGNSASSGFNPFEEFGLIGDRIINVHVKDRTLGGATVPLGQGNADFSTVYDLLKSYDYSGNYILQTARAQDEQHSKVLNQYKEFVTRGLT